MSELPDPADRLDSWKEIAAFLGRTVRTVQRWEKTAGLPVRRGGPGQRSLVVASKREIAVWWEHRRDSLVGEAASRVPDPVSHHRRRVVGAAVLLVVVAAGLLAVWRWSSEARPLPPSESESVPRLGRILAASTSEGRRWLEWPVSSQPGRAVLISGRPEIWLPLPAENVVIALDPETGREIVRVPVLESPWPMLALPNGRDLAVGGLTEAAIVDTDSLSVRRFPLGARVTDLAISRDGRRLWAAVGRAGLRIIDTKTGRVTSRPSVGCPMYLAASPIEPLMFIAYQCHGPGGREGHDAIEIVNEPTGRSMLARSGWPLVGGRLALSPDGQLLWADAGDACMGTHYDKVGCPEVDRGVVVHVLRASSLEAVMTLGVPSQSWGAIHSVTPDGTRVVLSAGGIHVVNAALGQVEERLDLSSGTLTVSPDSRRVYMPSGDSGSLLVFPIAEASDARDLGGLASYWTGDGHANDVIGGTHALDPSVDYASGRLGQAFRFLPESPPLRFGVRFDVDVSAGPATLGAWIRPGSRVGAMTLIHRASSLGFRWWLTPGGETAFCLPGAPGRLACAGGGVVSRRRVSKERWHHVAVVRTSDAVTLFIDGAPDATSSLNGYDPPRSVPPDQLQAQMGGSPGHDDAFVGLLDEVVAFQRALSAAEIALLMGATTYREP